MGRTDLEVGTVLDRTYELTGKLGSGGMGTVWQARHLRLPKAVAVKVLREAIDTGSDVYARFRREAEIASELGHPHIVEALDFNTLDDGSPYLVLELLRGQSLRDRIQRGGPMDLELIAHVTRQIASALQAAHAHGVVHRDLKPENVFLCEVEGEALPHVKILDFGISKLQTAQTALTQEGMIFGTPHYMAPEQAKGIDAEPAADQFALACIVYEMLTGQLAFSGTPVQVLYQVVHEEPEPLAELAPGLPAGVATTVERALSKQPTARFSDVTTFARELARTAGVPVSTPTPSVAPAASLPTVVAQPAPPDLHQATLQGPAAVPRDLAFQETMASPAPAPIGPTQSGPTESGPAESGPAGTPEELETPPSPPSPSGRRGLLAGGIVLALAVGAMGAYLLATRGTDESRPAPRATTRPEKGSTPSNAAPDAAGPPDAAVVARSRDRSVPRDARRPVAPKRDRPRPTALSPEVRAELQKARKLLRTGRSREAAAIAERLIRELPEHQRWPAHAILACVACVQSRLAAFRAHLANIPRPRRSRVKKFCSRYLDIVD
jgi:serine/threonine-protein kinase